MELDENMAAITRAVRVATRGRILTRSMKQWTPGARRYKSGSNGDKSYGTSTVLVIGGALLGGAVVLNVSSCINMKCTHRQINHVLWYVGYWG